MSKKLMIKDHNEIRSRPATDEYRKNWDATFGKKNDKTSKDKD